MPIDSLAQLLTFIGIIAENRENGSEPEFRGTVLSPIELASALCALAAVYRAPRRPALTEAWQGPGEYHIWLEHGLSQSTSWDKLDDCTVECRRVGDA